MPEALPSLIRPMLAVAGPLPPAAEESRWAYEMKWDGVRALVYLHHDRVVVRTRNDRDVTATYPELGGLAGALGRSGGVLDGEIVALADGRPSFGALQSRMHVQRPGAALLRSVPVSLLVFDLLHAAGRSLLSAPYDERRAALESAGLDGEHWATPPAFSGDGASALAASRAQGLEGVVAKRRASLYQPGRRSHDWVKAKHIRMQEVVVGGWRPGEGRRAGGIGSLLLGVPDAEGRLVYAGHVGTGFTAGMLEQLAAQLAGSGRRTPPFADEVPRAHARDAHWVEPELVGEVAFTEWTREGRLRHPSWRGLRPDKSPADLIPPP